MIELTLPWPPSVNSYWRSVPLGKFVKVTISAKGREYAKEVARIVTESGMACQRGAIAIKRTLYCPDWRERDEDNTAKAIYDSLTKAGAIQGDEFVCAAISEKRKSADKEGRVVVQIKRIETGVTVKPSGA